MSIASAFRSRMDSLRERLSRQPTQPKAAPKAVAKPEKVKVPYTSTKTVHEVEFKPSYEQVEDIMDYRERMSHQRMNNTRKHRQMMKAHHKRMAKMNPMYRVKS